MDPEAKKIQERIQELYNIPLPQFNAENDAEVRQLLEQMEEMGYERAEDDSIDAVRFVKYGKKKTC